MQLLCRLSTKLKHSACGSKIIKDKRKNLYRSIGRVVPGCLSALSFSPSIALEKFDPP